MPGVTWNREDLAWAAGLFEGEGSILTKRGKSGKTGIGLALGSTDRDVLEHFTAVMQLGGISGPYGPYAGIEHYKPMYHWRVNRFEVAQAALVALWPWLGERRRATGLAALKEVRDAPTRRMGTHDRCGRGHPRNSETAIQNDRGHYRCVICRRLNEKARRERRNAAAAI